MVKTTVNSVVIHGKSFLYYLGDDNHPLSITGQYTVDTLNILPQANVKYH